MARDYEVAFHSAFKPPTCKARLVHNDIRPEFPSIAKLITPALNRIFFGQRAAACLASAIEEATMEIDSVGNY